MTNNYFAIQERKDAIAVQEIHNYWYNGQRDKEKYKKINEIFSNLNAYNNVYYKLNKENDLIEMIDRNGEKKKEKISLSRLIKNLYIEVIILHGSKDDSETKKRIILPCARELLESINNFERNLDVMIKKSEEKRQKSLIHRLFGETISKLVYGDRNEDRELVVKMKKDLQSKITDMESSD